MSIETRSFFYELGRLAGSAQQENQFSRTFRVCFEHSVSFRRCVINLLRNVCSIRKKLPAPEEWECTVEVPTPLPSRRRIDLRIHAIDPSAALPVFYLESKLESPLTKEQLQQYRRRGVEYLIAVTKYPPAITRDEAMKAGIFVLRWQDLHRELLRQPTPRHRDLFISHSMVEYMEDLGMTYRESLKLKDLELCRRILRTAGSDRDRDMNPRNGFMNADSCVRLLQDVRARFLDLFPKLATCRTWGPGYFVTVSDCNKYHGFGWDLYRRHYDQWRFGCRIYLPDNADEPLTWCVSIGGSVVEEDDVESPLKSALTRGVLDPQKLLASLTKAAERWKVIDPKKSKFRKRTTSERLKSIPLNREPVRGADLDADPANADWIKMSWDLPAKNLRQLRAFLEAQEMTAAEFKKLPAYKFNLKRVAWLRRL